MTQSAVFPVLMGAIAMASAVAAMFFLRFWSQTRDGFFLYFAAAFFIDAIARVALAIGHPSDEEEPFYYAARLFTFGLIIIAIIQKNRSSGRPKS
jgi:uncharacterized membrane protein HdeD (DUF308 family)